MDYPITKHQQSSIDSTKGGELSPAQNSALSEFAALRASIDAHTAALTTYRPPDPIAVQGAVRNVPAPQYQAPQYQAPSYQAPQYGQYSPVFKPTIVVHSSASQDDHSSGGHWWPIAFAALFFLPFLAIAVGGGD